MMAKIKVQMPKHFIFFFLFLALFACDKKPEAEKAVAKIPMDIKVVRFDKLFFETPPQDLPKLKRQFPYFFPGSDDKVWTDKMQDPQWRALYAEVERKFPDFGVEKTQAEDLFRHVKYYFPKTRTPKIVTLIGEMDYHNKVIDADSLMLVSLELYLGANHKFYDYPKYLKQNFEPAQMMPDMAEAVAKSHVPPASDATLLAGMVYYGKILYLKDLFLPETSDAQKIGYLPEQLKWCEENEADMWRYFIDGKLLYDTDSRLPGRFLTESPFSKFYLEIDNESPGRVGQWIGWQIVRSFMQHNDVALQKMLMMDARQIFEQSHYKPKQHD
jgi:gliding motility-associated lipoprotein GldB